MARYLRGEKRALAVPCARLAIRFVLGDGSGDGAAVAEAGLGTSPGDSDARGTGDQGGLVGRGMSRPAQAVALGVEVQITKIERLIVDPLVLEHDSGGP